MTAINAHPFLFFFIDDLLPDCFGQKKGMTFHSLLTDEPTTDKITYDGIKRNFQNLHAEFEAFDEFYEGLKTITNRNDFFRQQIIGKNKKTHTRGNNLFELEFSPDGRMDVSIIQNDGIKCVFILDVRISNHYDKSDNVVHAKNDALASRILSALDEREIHKTKSMVESDAAFKNGLITYQNELLESINTMDAKFEILLNTLDAIIVSNKSIEAKTSLFFDKLYDITQSLNETDQKKFDAFVEQQLASDNIKQYHKELLQKLWYFESSEEEKKALQNSFNKIKIAKTFAKSFLAQATDMTEEEKLTSQNIMDMYRVFNKIPTSHLYVLKDELNDVDINIQNTETPSDITVVNAQKQTEHFLNHLIHLKTHKTDRLYPQFKHLYETYYKGKIGPLSSKTARTTPSTKTIDDMLYIPMSRLSDKNVIDTLSYGLMHIMIQKNPSMRSLIDNPKNEDILNHPNTFGYQWLDKDTGNETLMQAIDRLVLTPNPHIENRIYEHYPFLKLYITQFRQNNGVPHSKLNTIYTTLNHYTTEKEFDDVYETLKTLSAQEQEILHAYFVSPYTQTPDNINIRGYILGSLEVIEWEKAQKQKKKNKKKIVPKEQETEKVLNKQIRQNFVDTFNTFFNDVDNNDKKQALVQAITTLNEPILNGLKTLPKNDILGIFIRNYTQNIEQNKLAFDKALEPVILEARETKKSQFSNALSTFLENPKQDKNAQNLERMCSSLSQQDWAYLTNAYEQNPQLYVKEKLFLNAYQHYDGQQFTSLLDTLQNNYQSWLKDEQEKRITTFETMVRVALQSSDKKENDRLVEACIALTKEDVAICKSQNNMVIPAKILIKKIAPIIEQNMPNPADRFRTHIETVRQLNEFQNTLVDFMHHFDNPKYRRLVTKKYLQLSAQDLEIFVDLNQTDTFLTGFFKKLFKTKRMTNDLNQQHKECDTIIESTLQKLRLYSALSNFVNKETKDADKKLVYQFLSITRNGYTELSKFLVENANSPFGMFFLKKLAEAHKTAAPNKQQAVLLDTLDKNKWVVDFWHCIKNEANKTNVAIIDYKSDPTVENFLTVQIQNEIMKSQITSLPLEKITTLLEGNIFKETSIQDDLIKIGIFKAFMNFNKIANTKFNNKEAKNQACTTLLTYCTKLQDRHCNEIMQNIKETHPIVNFIKELKKHHQTESLDNTKEKLGNKEYQNQTMKFLNQKFNNLLMQCIKNLRPYTRD